MIQTGEQINNNLIESQRHQRLILDLRGNDQSTQLLNQYLSAEGQDKKWAHPEKVDWNAIASKTGFLDWPTNLHQLAESLGERICKGQLNGLQEPKNGGEVALGHFAPEILEGVPFYSKWLDFNSAHRLEKQSLPEFFGEKPSKTPSNYLRIRNFIIEMYWRTPEVYLTATACRRCVSGDAPAVLRVHCFLENWGIINRFASANGKGGVSKDTIEFQNFAIPQSNSLKTENKNSEKEVLSSHLAGKQGLKDSKPRLCFQCQDRIGFSGYSLLSFQEKSANFPKTVICASCFSKSKYPVFYGPENWRYESFEKAEFSEADKKQTIDSQISIIEQLTKSKDFSSTHFDQPNGQASEYISGNSMKFLPGFLYEKQSDFIFEHLKTSKDGNHGFVKSMNEEFARNVISFSECLNQSQTEKQKESLEGKIKEQEKAMAALKEIGRTFGSKAERVSIRLKFFEEADRIIAHEKQNLNLI